MPPNDVTIRRFSIALAILLAISFSAPIEAVTPPVIEPPADYTEIVESITRVIRGQLEQQGVPAVSICLVDEDQIIWAAGFGQATATRPASAATIHRVGSVSKLFTDVALMRLAEQGRVTLDEPVDKYIPEFQPTNPFDKPVTLRQLASHLAGLVREPPIGHYFDPTNPSLRDTVLSLNQSQLVYAPEERTKYSNAGVAVIGYAIERVTAKPFPEIMNEMIFQPLGMDDSGFVLTDQLRAELADGLMWSYDGRMFPAPTFPLGIAPAGNLYSNVVDLGKFAVAVLNGGQGKHGQILSSTSLAAMTEPQFSGEKTGFGIGFRVKDFDGHRLIGHNGAVYGFSTEFDLLPEQQLGVVVAASRDVCNGWVERIAHYSLRCLLARKRGHPLPHFPQTDPFPAARSRQADGQYANDVGATVSLIERNGRLFMRHGDTRVELRGRGDELIQDDSFGYGTSLVFQDSNAFKMNGKTFHRRSNDDAPPPLPEKWRGIVGSYGWDHNELFVFEDQGKLHCLIEWFYYYPLTELGGDRFAFPDFGLYHGERIVFERDQAGIGRRVVAAGIVFERRPGEPIDGATFRIKPQGPIEELLANAQAASMPRFEGDFRKPDLVEIVSKDDSIKLDIRYASTNNFLGAQLYDQARAYLQRDAADALVRAHQALKPRGYGLLIHDAYRPWFVTKMFWEATPTEMKIFVANPSTGSRHNRGCAVDLTLYELPSGQPVDMGAGYDEFSSRSFPDYEVASSRMRWHRELLRDAMEEQGFTIYEFEWWHFDYQDWRKYPIMNVPFEK